MAKIKAIIFDLDNTLIEFLKVKGKAQDKAIEAMIKAGMTADKVRAKKIMRRLLMKHGIEYQKIFDDMLKEIMGKIDMRILAAGVVAYRKVKGDLMEPYPKVIPTLKKLRKKVKFMGIVTDAPKFQAWTRLYEMNLDNCFDFVLTLDDTGAEKPTGIPFKTAMKMLGLRPNEVLVVGDWMSRDIIPANKLGMKTVFAKYGAMWKEKNKADYTINKIEDILKIV